MRLASWSIGSLQTRHRLLRQSRAAATNVVTMFICAVVSCASWASGPDDWHPTKQEVDAFAQRAVQGAKESMKDPDAAKFKDLFISRHTYDDSDGKRFNTLWLCGQINGKNSYGGYTGFHRFAFTDQDAGGSSGLSIEPEDESREFFREARWDRYCDKPLKKLASPK